MLQMMHVSGHNPQKTFMDYIKLSSEEIADEIAAMSKKDNGMWRPTTIIIMPSQNNFVILQ